MKRTNIKYLLVSLILILFLTLSAGCNLLPSTTISPPPQPASPPTTENVTPIDSGWSIPFAESQTPALPSIADVVAKVKPSVVAINTKVVTLDILNRPRTQEGAGSGWIIDKNGIIVTNNHVVGGAESITVTLDDGRTFPVDMQTVATDALADLAVLKIDTQNLPAVTVGDSEQLRVGDWVVAIGNALGEGISATNGIVSRRDVSISVDSGQTLYNLVQTNAAINPGNSGGPLVNMVGEVIGITSAKLSAVGIEAMGYAISTKEAMPIIQQLINTGYVIRPFLGVQGLLTVDQSMVTYFKLRVNEGVLIRGIVPNGPADKARLQAGDVITKFGDQEITNVDELLRAIHSAQVGKQVAIAYWRGETKNTTYVTLAESPPPS